jgi:hypothetical protein
MTKFVLKMESSSSDAIGKANNGKMKTLGTKGMLL